MGENREKLDWYREKSIVYSSSLGNVAMIFRFLEIFL